MSYMSVATPSLSIQALLGAVLVVGFGCAAETADEIHVGVLGGESATDRELIGGDMASAGSITATLNVEGKCTAARVGERHILLAAHCVQQSSMGARRLYPSVQAKFRPGAEIRVTDGNVISQARWTTVTVKKTHVHPAWFDQCRLNGCYFDHSMRGDSPPDVAIVETVQPVPGTIAEIDSSAVQTGDELIINGYGCEDTALDAAPANRLKQARAFADDAPANVTNRNYFETPATLGGGAAGLCPGDSGGPVYRAELPLRVVGINAYYRFKDESGLPEANVHTRIGASADRVDGWLDSVLNPAAPTCDGIATFAHGPLAERDIDYEMVSSAVRLRCAMLGSVPTLPELADWVDRFAAGEGLSDYGDWLTRTVSYVQTHGGASHEEYVASLWESGLGQPLHEGWHALYSKLLNDGEVTRTEIALILADSVPFRNRVDSIWR